MQKDTGYGFSKSGRRTLTSRERPELDYGEKIKEDNRNGG